MSSARNKRLVVSALMLALALVLPYFTGGIPAIGNLLLPMHLPVLLCGFLCGGPWGALVGFIAPLMRSVLTGGFPPMFPTALAMAFELPPMVSFPACFTAACPIPGLAPTLLWQRL